MIDSTTILQESYFGKDDILLQCEECIKAMKEAIITGKNPNSISEKITFESLIAKKFNCEKVYLSILADETGLNAYTMPFYYEKNRSYTDNFFELISDSSGVRYKSATGKTLYIYINTYTIRNFSIDSCMAIILHEIGHNFYFIKEQVQNRKAKIFTEFVLYLLQLLDRYNYDAGLVVEVVKVLINEGINFKKGLQQTTYEQTKKFLTDKAFDIVNKKYESDHTGIGKAFFILRMIIDKPLKKAFRLGKTIIYTLVFPLLINAASYKEFIKQEKKEQGYNAEKFCDNFAASYGYAKGVFDAFNNPQDFTYRTKITSKIPLVRIYNYYSDMLFQFTKHMNDEHPSDMKRATFAIEKLKYELTQNRKDMDPKQIAEIEADIEAMEKLIKKTPYFKRAVNAMFAGIDAKRDAAGSVGIGDEEIFDFDKSLLKDKVSVKKEDLGIEAYMTEDYEAVINTYYESPVMEMLSE